MVKDIKKVFMYSGQGSQYYHMGAKLYKNNSIFKYWMDKMDIVAKAHSGESIVAVLYDSTKTKSDSFDELTHTHPAIFMIEYALTQVVIAMGIKPDYLLGVSLGEYIALAVSGACGYEKVLELLIVESRMIKEKNITGGMIAVMASKDIFLNHLSAYGNCELAADNFEGHFVISGAPDDLEKARDFLKQKEINYQDLAVNYPFHSGYMSSIEDEFKTHAANYKIGEANTTLVSCAYSKIEPVVNTKYLWDVVRKPIHFQNTIKELELHDNLVYIDLGPSGTLSTFVSYILESKENTFPVMSPFVSTQDNLNKLQESLLVSSAKEINGICNEIPRSKNNLIINTNKKMKTYVFPGQGSQKKGMGAELFKEFGDIVRKADQILGYSIEELCVKDPRKQLMQTEFAQVAIYVVNALYYYKKTQYEGKPDFVAGHSLGEFNALLASGVFDFETGLRLVKKRGALMATATGGGMAAVKSLRKDEIINILKENAIDSIDIANFNSPDQIVISGPKKDILKIQPLFEDAGADLYLPLYVSGAFHSRYMKESSEEFRLFIKGFKFSSPQIPVIANVTARPYEEGSVKENLTKQITSSVKWSESIQYLMGRGEMQFEEIGDNTILMKMIHVIQSRSSPIYEKKESTFLSKKPNKVEAVKRTTVFNIPNTTIIEKPNYTAQTNNVMASVNQIESTTLGSSFYKETYNLKHAYASGSMYRGVSSSDMVIAMAKAGMMSYFGSGGISLPILEKEILTIKSAIGDNHSFGFNLIHNMEDSKKEEDTINLYIKHKVKNIEASAFMQVSKSLVKYRLKGLEFDSSGEIISKNRIQAKVSRPEVAAYFLAPAPEKIVQSLLASGEISLKQAEMAKKVPMATELCVEGDSGGHTDRGVIAILFPSIKKLKEEMQKKYSYKDEISIGIAGGIGTPEAAAIAFLLGADFIVTGSINQCTVESGTSDAVKDILETINVQDTAYAPAGDMFEIGAKVQVVKKGIFFPARANYLFDLYNRYNSYDEIPKSVQLKLEKSYFKKTISEVYKDCKGFYSISEIDKAECNGKFKMAMLFKWYFGYSNRVALNGDKDDVVNYQIHCGSALGAFNQWVKGTNLERWRNRNVGRIGERIMVEAEELLMSRLDEIITRKKIVNQHKKIKNETINNSNREYSEAL